MINWIGSVATAVVAVSYFCRQPKMLRMVQSIAALMWATYGFLIGAMAMVVGNVIVALAAVYSSFGPAPNSSAA
jgi:Bacterial inner membrane protein